MVNIEQVNSTVEWYVQFDVHCPGRQIPKDPEDRKLWMSFAADAHTCFIASICF